MLGQGLCDQARRIAEINEPGVRRYGLDDLRLSQGYGKRSQGHSGSGRACGLLAGKAMFNGEPLIARPGFHAAHTNTAEHEISTSCCVLQIGSHADCKARAKLAHDFAANSGDGFGSLHVDVKQRDFADSKQSLGLCQAVNQQRGTNAAPSNDGYFSHRESFSSS